MMADALHAIWRNTLTVVGGVLAAMTILFVFGFLGIDLAAGGPPLTGMAPKTVTRQP